MFRFKLFGAFAKPCVFVSSSRWKILIYVDVIKLVLMSKEFGVLASLITDFARR